MTLYDKEYLIRCGMEEEPENETFTFDVNTISQTLSQFGFSDSNNDTYITTSTLLPNNSQSMTGDIYISDYEVSVYDGSEWKIIS